ncbi:protein of unknown function DUF4373 [Vibrio phage 2.095.A._10N.286.46.E10]|nr:protein of unknown function DUF4373 [Vibrio phage 2.095.A._10N.286.46.E10]AUS02225.1 protein of unknown function DUF4373 [Vibrio phage 2.095.B._10N.286.46.E10]
MQWIKHDTDANQDAKLQNVLLDYGLEGYGLYWYCIELIAGKVDANNITFELEHDARVIARNTGSTPQKVEEMMRYFVNIGLFENSNNTITCLKLAKRLTQSMTSNPQMREIIKNFKGHDGIMIESDEVMQDKIRSDKKRLDNKEPSRFAEFWDLYGKKVDSKKCESKFNKLTKKEIEEIFEVLPRYLQSTPDKQYRKNPLTWLNGKCWNDEVQTGQNNVQGVNSIGTDFRPPEGWNQ